MITPKGLFYQCNENILKSYLGIKVSDSKLRLSEVFSSTMIDTDGTAAYRIVHTIEGKIPYLPTLPEYLLLLVRCSLFSVHLSSNFSISIAFCPGNDILCCDKKVILQSVA